MWSFSSLCNSICFSFPHHDIAHAEKVTYGFPLPHDTAVLKIRIQIQIRPFPSVLNDSLHDYFQDLPEQNPFQLQSELCKGPHSGTDCGQLAHPQLAHHGHVSIYTENNWNKPRGSNAACAH